MKHVWSIICKQSITDKDTNLISLIESAEELHIKVDTEKLKEQKKINLFCPFEIVHFLLKDKNKKGDEKGSLLIEINVGDKIIQKITQDIIIPAEFKRIRIRTLLGSLPIEKEGEYLFEIKYKSENSKDYKKACEIPLLIIFEK
jgi:hypothetical protein